MTLKLSQLIIPEPVLKLRLLAFPLGKFSKGVSTFERLFRKRIPVEDVKFKATVSQDFEESAPTVTFSFTPDEVSNNY